MKKLLAVILALVMLASTGVAYAAGTNRGNAAEKRQVSADVQAQKAKLKELAAAIKDNHTQIQNLRTEVSNKIKQVRVRVKELKKDPAGLNNEKITESSEKLSLVRGDKAELANTWGLIAEQGLKLKMLKRSKDFAGAEAAFNNIINVQKQRIDMLNKANADLDALISIM